MSWYREKATGAIIVEGDFTKDHLNHGTWKRPDGKLILLDEGLLHYCGKEIKKRNFYGRRSSDEVTAKEPFEIAMKIWKRNGKSTDAYHHCPRTHKGCRFYNDVFHVCSIGRNKAAMVREHTPCSIDFLYRVNGVIQNPWALPYFKDSNMEDGWKNVRESDVT